MHARDRVNEAKADFADVYDEPDPRSYFRTLRAHDYQIPQHAKHWFLRILPALRSSLGRDRVTLLDVGCSYGINAALLRYDLDLEQLYWWYNAANDAGVSPEEAVENDRRMFQRRTADPTLRVIGLDAAANAARYAERVGLVNAVIVKDLEREPLLPGEASIVEEVDAVVSTGCVGYVTQRTFERLLSAGNRSTPPWVVSFVLRVFPYNSIAAALARHGLRTVKLVDETFVQRRFADDAERVAIKAELQARGVQSDDQKSRDTLDAELFVSLPPDAVTLLPFRHMWTVVADP